jgi:hypothetical protein
MPAEPDVTPQEFPRGTEIIEIIVAGLRRITYRGQ